MTTGRTTWSARDAAHHDRELVVELLEEFGPGGPYVEVVLRDLAQQQRDAGGVKTGFRSVGRKTKLTPDEVRCIVEYGAEIGLFDDLRVDTDGRRFTLRVSGWDADQTRGKSALKKADQRARDDTDDEPVTAEGDMSPSVTDSRGPRARASRVNQTRPDQEQQPPASGGVLVTFRRRRQPAHRVTLAEEILTAFNDQAGTRFGAYTGDNRPSDSLKRIIGAIVDHPDLDLETAKRLITHALKRPWWDGPASIGVVFGPGVIERNLAAANGHGVKNITSAELAAALSRDNAPPGDDAA